MCIQIKCWKNLLLPNNRGLKNSTLDDTQLFQILFFVIKKRLIQSDCILERSLVAAWRGDLRQNTEEGVAWGTWRSLDAHECPCFLASFSFRLEPCDQDQFWSTLSLPGWIREKWVWFLHPVSSFSAKQSWVPLLRRCSPKLETAWIVVMTQRTATIENQLSPTGPCVREK